LSRAKFEYGLALFYDADSALQSKRSETFDMWVWRKIGKVSWKKYTSRPNNTRVF